MSTNANTARATSSDANQNNEGSAQNNKPPVDYIMHGAHAVRMLGLSVQAKNSGLGRAILALVLAMRHEVIEAADVAHYMRATERKEKTKFLSSVVLDRVFGFDHGVDGTDGKKKAETKVRAMIGQCLIPALYLFQNVKFPPAYMLDSDGKPMIDSKGEPVADPNSEVVAYVAKSEGNSNERGFLIIPGRLLYKGDDTRGDAVANRDKPRVEVMGVGGATYEALFSRAREHFSEGQPNTGNGAQAPNDIRNKAVKEVSLSALVGEVTRQMAAAGAKDASMLEATMPALKTLRSQMLATMPLGDGLDDEDADHVGELEGALAIVNNIKYVMDKPAILGRLARLYDALEEIGKDKAVAAAMEAAKNA